MNKSTYLILSLINLIAYNYAGEWNRTKWFHIFSLLVITSQIMLVAGVKSLLSEKKSLLKSSFIVSKFFVLTIAFLVAARNIDNYLLICISFYIFQLLILVLSIKNNGSFK